MIAASAPARSPGVRAMGAARKLGTPSRRTGISVPRSRLNLETKRSATRSSRAPPSGAGGDDDARVDPRGGAEVADLDALVRHGVVLAPRPVHDAQHPGPREVGGVGAVEPVRRDGPHRRL